MSDVRAWKKPRREDGKGRPPARRGGSLGAAALHAQVSLEREAPNSFGAVGGVPRRGNPVASRRDRAADHLYPDWEGTVNPAEKGGREKAWKKTCLRAWGGLADQ